LDEIGSVQTESNQFEVILLNANLVGPLVRRPYLAVAGDQAQGWYRQTVQTKTRRSKMLIKLQVALPLALVLGMASAAIAAPKHADLNQPTAAMRQMSLAAYQSYGSVRDAGQVQEPEYMQFQDQGVRNEIGG
jgi:hypothetical protein